MKMTDFFMEPSGWDDFLNTIGGGESFQSMGSGLSDFLPSGGGDFQYGSDFDYLSPSGISDYVSDLPYYSGSETPFSLTDTLSQFNDEYLQPAGRFLQSPGGSFLGALGMGGLSYLDRASANKKAAKDQKRMLAQRQAILDQMNARAAKYDAPIMGAVNTRGPANAEWGAGRALYDNNSLAAIRPGSEPGYLSGFAEGGEVSGRWVESDRIDPNTRLPEMVWVADEPAPAPKPKAAPAKPQSALERMAAMFGVTSAIKKSQKAREGFAGGGYAGGGTPGQADQIPAMLSDGEFVIDAETVSMLGDGNNAAGASALEQMRRNIRRQKRSAPDHKIPPKAKKPEQYMKKGK